MRNKKVVASKAQDILSEVESLDYASDSDERTDIWITIEGLAADLLKAARPFNRKEGK